jgi:replicative DNA helicase
MTTDGKLVDTRAERAVLGSLLIDPDAVAKVADLVSPADFHDEGNRIVYDAALRLMREGTVADYVTMMDAIGDDDLRRIGNNGSNGSGYLLHLVNDTPSALRCTMYARIVRRLATLRGLMNAAGEIAKLAYNADGDELDGLFDRARRLLDARAPARSDEHLLMWLDSFDAFFAQQLDRCAEIDAQESGDVKPRATVPWKPLDRYVSYVRPGVLFGVIAPPGVGKTAMVEGLAEHWAQQGLKVAFFHLELSRQSMLDRRTCRQSGVSLRLVEDGHLDATMSDANERMARWPGGIHYVHCPGWGASRIARAARKLHDRGECDAMVVDYLQKMRRDFSQGLNAAQAVGWNIEVLKNCGEQLGVPVVLPAQLNVKGKTERVKTATYVRDTGELEDKANLLVTIDRPLLTADLKDNGGDPVALAGQRSPVADCRVDKNTFGPTGPFRLLFVGQRFMFAEESKVAEPLNF